MDFVNEPNETSETKRFHSYGVMLKRKKRYEKQKGKKAGIQSGIVEGGYGVMLKRKTRYAK